MSSPEILLKATINRISSRIEDKLLQTLDNLSVFSNNAPDRLRKEWESFQEEVYEEVSRLEKERDEDARDEDVYDKEVQVDDNNIDKKISNIREKINAINVALDSEI